MNDENREKLNSLTHPVILKNMVNLAKNSDAEVVFLPKHPVTKPKIEDINNSLSLLEVDKLIDEALANKKVYEIN